MNRATMSLLLSLLLLGGAFAKIDELLQTTQRRELNSVWEDVLASAAKETLVAIQRSSEGKNGGARFLESVPLDTLQVQNSTHVHLIDISTSRPVRPSQGETPRSARA